MPGFYKKIFKERKILNEDINPPNALDDFLFENFYMDSWYNKPFFGKIDVKGFPIIPKEERLFFTSFGKDSSQSQALDFVASLFKEVRLEYDANYRSGNLNKRSDFFKNSLKAVNGFKTSRPIYLEYAKLIYSKFLDYLINNNFYQKVNNYAFFIEEMKKY